MKKIRGRWSPSPAQVALIIDCATAKLLPEKAAQIVGIAPRTLKSFARRIGRPVPAPAGRPGAGKAVAPVPEGLAVTPDLPSGWSLGPPSS
jgi:hypothetical protein